MSYYNLSAYVETLGTACASGIGYNVGKGTGAWCTSDGTVTQTNSAAVINTNAATFPVPSVTTKVFFKAFLHSSGTSKYALDNIEIDGLSKMSTVY